MRYDDEDIILDKIINLPTYQTCSLGLSWTKTFGLLYAIYRGFFREAEFYL
jgi:hypothetical protein